MKKQILATSLVLGAAAIILSAGTMAYFTDTKSITNTFTVGNVEIELLESRLHRTNADGNSILAVSGVEKDGTAENTSAIVNGHEQPWSSGFFSDETIKNDAKTYKSDYFEKSANNIVPGVSIHKNPYILNTGKNDAYVRTRVLIPVSLFSIIDNGPSYWTTTAMNRGKVVSKAVNYYLANNYTPSNDSRKTIDGIDYYEFDFTYTDALKPGEMTFWNAWGNIAIAKNTTSAQLKDVDSFNVIVEADAIQADGFSSAEEAFAKF